MNKRLLLAASLCCSVSLAAIAQNSTGKSTAALPNDVVVVLDISGSMKKSQIFEDVKTYLKAEVAGKLLREGDRFTLIVFGRETRKAITHEKLDAASLAGLGREIAELKAGEDFTDLGKALESMDGALADRSDRAFKPHGIFITDGKHAPPPDSPYKGKNLALDDHFKATGERIAQKGWFLYVVALGGDTDAEVVAGAVPGSTVAEGSEALSGGKLAEYAGAVDKKTGEFLDAKAAEAARSKSASDAASAGSDGSGTSAGQGASGSGTEGKAMTFSGFVKIAAVIAGVALIALLVALFVTRRRKDDDDQIKRRRPLVK